MSMNSPDRKLQSGPGGAGHRFALFVLSLSLSRASLSSLSLSFSFPRHFQFSPLLNRAVPWRLNVLLRGVVVKWFKFKSGVSFRCFAISLFARLVSARANDIKYASKMRAADWPADSTQNCCHSRTDQWARGREPSWFPRSKRLLEETRETKITHVLLTERPHQHTHSHSKCDNRSPTQTKLTTKQSE